LGKAAYPELSAVDPKEKKELTTAKAPVAIAPMEDKSEMHNPFWCPAHGFVHGERLADHRPDCVLERPDHPRAGPVAPLRMQAPEVDARERRVLCDPSSIPPRRR
jgi:hypothetical protein